MDAEVVHSEPSPPPSSLPPSVEMPPAVDSAAAVAEGVVELCWVDVGTLVAGVKVAAWGC